MKYILRVIDFETTGIPDGETIHSVIECGIVDLCAENKTIIGDYQTLVAPTTPMDITALATHHISEATALREGHRWDDVKIGLELSAVDEKVIYVAHNAEFEKQFFNPYGSIWIDTYKVALKLYPDAPSHSNQVLKYYLGIDDNEKYYPPHRALPDCHVTAQILIKMAEKMTIRDMVKISKEPPYLTRIGFGKHKGVKFEELPIDYIDWLSRQNDIDEGTKAAVKRILNK